VSKLRPKQERFCEEYVIDFNGAQAAIRAGYSNKTAKEIAANLLTKINVQEYLAELKAKVSAHAHKSAADIRRELERVGFSDIKNVVSWNESGMAMLHNSDDIPDDISAAIESVEITEDAYEVKGSKSKEGAQQRFILKQKVKMHNKISALKELVRIEGMITDKVEHSGKIQHNVTRLTDEELEQIAQDADHH
jgi:phage terminase small subunit